MLDPLYNDGAICYRGIDHWSATNVRGVCEYTQVAMWFRRTLVLENFLPHDEGSGGNGRGCGWVARLRAESRIGEDKGRGNLELCYERAK